MVIQVIQSQQALGDVCTEVIGEPEPMPSCEFILGEQWRGRSRGAGAAVKASAHSTGPGEDLPKVQMEW